MYISIQYKICTYCIVTYFSIMAEATVNGLGIPTNGIAPIQHTHANQTHYLNLEEGLELDSDDEDEDEDEDEVLQGELSSIGNDHTGYSSSSYGHTTREDDSSNIGSMSSVGSMSTGLLAFASPIASPNVSINSIGGRRARSRSRSRSRSKTRRKSRAKRGNKTTRRRRRTKKNKKRKERNDNKKRVRFSTRPTQKNNKSLRIVKK